MFETAPVTLKGLVGDQEHNVVWVDLLVPHTRPLTRVALPGAGKGNARGRGIESAARDAQA